MVTNFVDPLPFSSFSRSLSPYFLSFIQDMIFGLSIWRYNDIGLNDISLAAIPEKTASFASSEKQQDRSAMKSPPERRHFGQHNAT